MSELRFLMVRAICMMAAFVLFAVPLRADPFVGTRTYTFRSDSNIGDGVQVHAMTAEGAISYVGGSNYTLDFSSPDANPIDMVRDGDWLKLDAPQTFVTDATIHAAAVVSDGSGGAMLMYVQDTFPGASPNDYSVSYSVWSDVVPNVSADDLVGQWEVKGYGHWNLLHDSSPFFHTSEIITVTSLGGSRISVLDPTQGTFTMLISGNELLPEGPLWHDGRMFMTADHLFFGNIGVEDYDPTDIGLGIGYVSRVPEPATLSLLALGLGAMIIRRRRSGI